MSVRKQIVLRVAGETNTAVRRAAKAAGLSINAYCEKTLGRAAGRTGRGGATKKAK